VSQLVFYCCGLYIGSYIQHDAIEIVKPEAKKIACSGDIAVGIKSLCDVIMNMTVSIAKTLLLIIIVLYESR
jgi:hypothetical protein